MADPRARWRLYCSLRTALERLTAALDDYELLWSFPESTLGAPLGAEMDEPAVQSREPASVVGESSDEHCWRWYTYCPEEGLDMYSDRKQAQSAAQSIIGSYEVAAHSDGWHEDMESVSWGMLVPVEQAQVVERKTAEPDDEFDEWVKYGLRPVRWVHPAPQPPATNCAPMIHPAPTNNRDPWQHRSDGMRCKSCMWFAPKLPDLGSPELKSPEPGVIEVPAFRVGRCRRHAPTMNGYPVVFVNDWCGDHKLDENWQQSNEVQP